MRSAVLVICLVASSFPSKSLAAPPDASAPAPAAADAASPANQECLGCHEATKPGESGVRVAAFAKSVHGGLSCTDCHAGYVSPGPHDLPAPSDPAEAALVRRLATGKNAEDQPRTAAPRAYLACAGCHPDTMETFRASAHGRWWSEDRSVAGPTCASCHGSPHEVPTPPERGTAAFRPYWTKLAATCERCHADPKFIEAAKLNQETATNYHDSIHGRLVAIGSTKAPVCTDCHGWSVRPAGKDDPRKKVIPGGHATMTGPTFTTSSVHFSNPPRDEDNRVITCAQCHAGANHNFAGLISHRPLQDEGKLPHLIHLFFSYLTTATLLFFAGHVAIDMAYELRTSFQRRKKPHAPVPAPLRGTVVRLDLHQRIQHWLMLSGVILLAITGWPLRGAGSVDIVGANQVLQRVESSRRFLHLFGGPANAGIFHRIGAVLIIASGVYHLTWLVMHGRRGTLAFSMVPTPKDAFDMRDNVLFLLGLRKERPRFERFSYLEKFDYWAVFWGIIMMVGSGFIFWYPVFFSRFLPTWMLVSAQIVHGEEATLAAIFLFIVHFYYVHLKPSIFPMNWTWLTGTISLELLEEEHPVEFDRLMAKRREEGKEKKKE